MSVYARRDDILMEVNVTPNRADCLSHIGLSREIACVLNRKLKPVRSKLKAKKGLSVKSGMKVKVLDPSACPRYSVRLIEGGENSGVSRLA